MFYDIQYIYMHTENTKTHIASNHTYIRVQNAMHTCKKCNTRAYIYVLFVTEQSLIFTTTSPSLLTNFVEISFLLELWLPIKTMTSLLLAHMPVATCR